MKFIILSVCIASIMIGCKLQIQHPAKLPVKIYYYFGIENINNLERYALIKYHSIENKQLHKKIVTNTLGENKIKNSNEEIIYCNDKGLDKEWFTTDDILSPVHTKAYNDRGDLIKKKVWTKFGSNNDYNLTQTRYHYDYASKIFYQTEYISGSNQIAFYYRLEYDERGITKQIQYDGCGDDKLWYTKDDLITENDFFCIEHHYNRKGKLIRKTIYENTGIDNIFLTEDDVEE